MADQKKKRTPEEAREASQKGTFIGSVIGGIIASLLMSGGVSFGVSKSTEKDLTAQQEAFQKYVDEKLTPQLEKQLDEVVSEIDADLDEIEARAVRAEKDAYAALKALEVQAGMRAVERAKKAAEAAVEPHSTDLPLPPLPAKVKTHLPRYEDMQQKLAD